MFGKHRSKGIEPRVNRLHSSSFVAVRDFTTNPLLGGPWFTGWFRRTQFNSLCCSHFLTSSWFLLSDVLLKSVVRLTLMLNNKRTGERDGCFSRSSFIQRLAKEAEKRRTGGAEIPFIQFLYWKQAVLSVSFTPSSCFTKGSDIWWNIRWERHEWKSFAENMWGAKQDNIWWDCSFVDQVMVSNHWVSFCMTNLKAVFLTGREVFSTDYHCRISSGWQGLLLVLLNRNWQVWLLQRIPFLIFID